MKEVGDHVAFDDLEDVPRPIDRDISYMGRFCPVTMSDNTSWRSRVPSDFHPSLGPSYN